MKNDIDKIDKGNPAEKEFFLTNISMYGIIYKDAT